jgi:hypothetical protein
MKLIAACLELPLSDEYGEASGFSDWDAVADWARPYAAALIKSGIVLGSEERGGLYLKPAENITREEMAAMAIRALGIVFDIADPAYGMYFEDYNAPGGWFQGYIRDYGAIRDWAADSALFAMIEGLINTRDSTGAPIPPEKASVAFINDVDAAQSDSYAPAERYFSPEAPARRDEAAVILSLTLAQKKASELAS